MITRPLSDVFARKEFQGIVSVRPSATTSEAVAVMNRSGVGAVIVIDASGQVAGIFTERDVMRRVVGERRDADILPVSEVMTAEVRHVPSSTTVEEALRLMVVHGYRHLLVGDGARISGVVSIRDLMRWMIMPDAPIAYEGRVGVIRQRTQDALSALQPIDEPPITH